MRWLLARVCAGMTPTLVHILGLQRLPDLMFCGAIYLTMLREVTQFILQPVGAQLLLDQPSEGIHSSHLHTLIQNHPPIGRIDILPPADRQSIR